MTTEEWEDMPRSARRKFRENEELAMLTMSREYEAAIRANERPVVPPADDDTAAWLADVIEAGGGPCGPEGVE